MNDLQFHPVADIFPMMSEQEFAGLVADVRDRGLLEPVWLHADGRIIDGRNRYRACVEAEREPRFRTYDGTDADLVPFVVSLNVHRRHMNESQRAMVAEKIANARQGERRDIVEISTMSQAEAADLLNVSRDTVSKARKVATQGVPELAEKVISGEIAVSTAAIIAEFDEETQHRLAAMEDKRQIRALAREIDAKEAEAKPGAHVGNNSGDNEWYTPIEYIKAAREVMGGIDLDPASSAVANETVGATTFFTESLNGLERQWAGRVWMNPPYAQPLVDNFSTRLVSSYAAGDVTEACVLVNNATETKWFQALAGAASGVAFPRGRVKFWHPTKIAIPLQGQAVLYLGPNVAEFTAEFSSFGFVAAV